MHMNSYLNKLKIKLRKSRVKMPKIACTNSNKLSMIVNEYGKNVFSTDKKVLLCSYCGIKVNHTKKYFIQQHLNTAKHKAAAEINLTSKAQLVTSFSANTSDAKEFLNDFMKMMVACDIALHKVKHPEFNRFFQKYTARKLPDESNIRKNYINSLHENVLEKIRSDIGDSSIYVSIDETTDADGRFLCNVVIGALRKNARGFLLSAEVIDKVNASQISQVFDNALKILWPESVHREKVLVFVSDAAPYMTRCGKALKLLYPKLLHITCIAHGMHRTCEKIRSEFPDLDAFIANAKKIFLKSAFRISSFKEKYPHLPLPPKPVLTRWGTWLQAAIYYAHYFDELKEYIEELNDDAICVTNIKNCLRNEALPAQLSYILTNFSFIVHPCGGILTKVQKRGTTIGESLDILDAFESGLKDAIGPTAKEVLKKYNSVFSKNPDLKTIRAVNLIVGGAKSNLPANIEVKDVQALNYSPLVSVEVERTFSCFKSIMRDNRRSMLPENFTKHLIALCFYNNDNNETVVID